MTQKTSLDHAKAQVREWCKQQKADGLVDLKFYPGDERYPNPVAAYLEFSEFLGAANQTDVERY